MPTDRHEPEVPLATRQPLRPERTGALLHLRSADGRVALGPLSPRVTGRLGRRPLGWSPYPGPDGSARGGPGGLALRWDLREVDGAVELGLTVVNEGREPIVVDRLVVLETGSLELGVDPRRWSVYRNGHQSWSGTRAWSVHERDRDMPTHLLRAATTDAAHPAVTDVGHFRSDTLSAVVETGTGEALGLGFVTTADAFGFVEVDAPHGRLRRLSAWCDLDGTVLAPGASLGSEVLRVVAHRSDDPVGDAGGHALADVAAAAGARMGARTVGGHPGGWCSWYFYFQHVTEADVRENLATLAADGPGGPEFGCRYVMVDDGHQAAIGDWLTTAASFPSGMTHLAGDITAAGFDAGIWLAPFLAGVDSETARAHPDWLVRNRIGRPVTALVNPAWGRHPIAALDTTHPAVLAHLEEVARTVRHEWGYRILKLDFLYAASLPGRRHRPTTRAASLRAGLDAIRRGAGDDAFLLGCGCPLGPAIGVVDAMRIGADVTPSWTQPWIGAAQRGLHGLSTRHAIRNTVTRAFLDDRWWDNDPDCLMVRATDTTLSLAEVRTLATAIGMTNGMIVLSDRIADLAEDRRRIVATTRDLAGGRFRALDLFTADLPEQWVSEHANHTDVAVANLGEEARPAAFDLAGLGLVAPEGLRDRWTGEAVEVRGGVARWRSIPPHSVRLLRIPR